jgi:hypothetical protein
MKNITITLDEKTASLVRVHAARRNVSVSRYIGEVLQRTMQESREYDVAMQRFLSKKPFLHVDPQSHPTREEINDRSIR